MEGRLFPASLRGTVFTHNSEINNKNAECFGLFLEACSPNNCNKQKQKVEMIINERGLNSLERMKKK